MELVSELDPVGIVNDAIEDGIGKREIADDLMVSQLEIGRPLFFDCCQRARSKSRRGTFRSSLRPTRCSECDGLDT